MVSRVSRRADPAGRRLRRAAGAGAGRDGGADRRRGGHGAPPAAAGAPGAAPAGGHAGLGGAGGAGVPLGRTPAPARSRSRPSRGTRAAVAAADLVTLTKPRIISLLLVTTDRADVHHAGRASRPGAWSSGCSLGGYLMAGGANAINMWFDRDIDNRMARTRLRPIPAGRISAGFGLAFGVGARAGGLRGLLVPGQPAERVARARRAPVLRLHLHHLAQADEPAEHRDRRRGRRVPAAGGLGGDDRPARPGRDLPVRHHLLLDAAALLGAGAHQAGATTPGPASR